MTAQVIIDGVWRETPLRGEVPRRQVVDTSHVFERLVKNLAVVLAEAATMSPAEQRRFTGFMLAAGSLSMAQTRLEGADKELFESALREANARMR
jgi:hypothetical protein